MKKAYVIWFTGRHGSGKSTIAGRLSKIFKSKNIPFVLLDGDEVRKAVSFDLGYSLDDRNKHMKRVAGMCKLISGSGVNVIASVASPTEKSREYARSNLKNLFMVYVKCSAEVCERRDVKGHYKKARLKEKGYENFVGIHAPFEEPRKVDITLETEKESIDVCMAKLEKALEHKEII